MKAPKSRKVAVPDVPDPAKLAAEAPSEPTIGTILGLPSTEPTLPGFAMADTVEQLPDPADPGRKPHVPGESEPPTPDPDPDKPEPNEDDSNPGEEYPGDQPNPINPPWTPPPPIDHEPPAAQAPDGSPAQAAALNDQLEDLNDARRAIYEKQRGVPGRPPALPIREDRSLAQQVLDGEILDPTAPVRWVSRIEIVDAWKYSGQLTTAPDWVDRNWLGWGDFDNFRNIEPGPCLRVPAHGRPGEVVLCRIGDWICRQAVTVDTHLAPQLRIEVWAGEHFEQMFMARPLADARSQAKPARAVKEVDDAA